MENKPIIERLARIEEKLDALLFRTVNTETKLDGHEGRIRHLEVGYGKIVAISGVVALSVSSFLGLFHAG